MYQGITKVPSAAWELGSDGEADHAPRVSDLCSGAFVQVECAGGAQPDHRHDPSTHQRHSVLRSTRVRLNIRRK
jgi:hypothetical protein